MREYIDNVGEDNLKHDQFLKMREKTAESREGTSGRDSQSKAGEKPFHFEVPTSIFCHSMSFGNTCPVKSIFVPCPLFLRAILHACHSHSLWRYASHVTSNCFL